MMFAADRQRMLDSGFWTPINGKLGYIEVWTERIEGGIGKTDYRTGLLQDDEVEDWLHNWGRFATEQSSRLVTATASVRLLLCERIKWPNLGISMSKRSFLEVEKAFDLPPEALPLLNALGGREFCNLRFQNKSADQHPESISLSMKIPQMFQVGNLGCSLTHRLTGNNTLALAHGWHLLSDKNAVAGESVEPHQNTILKLIQSMSLYLNHPLLLPFVLLKDHMDRGMLIQGWLSSQVTEIEEKFGVTLAGRLVQNTKGIDSEVKKAIASAEDRISVISQLNTASTDLINLERVMLWDRRYAAHIRYVGVQLAKLKLPISSVANEGFNSLLDYVEGTIENEISFTASLSSRLDLQLNVVSKFIGELLLILRRLWLYNLISHAETDLNSKIAMAAGLDSSAMKTLAFVTIVFLPPTFVATLFSMSMFDWQESEGDDKTKSGTVLSHKFWVYWAISVPLTVVVILGWRLWWQNQKSYYAGRYKSN